MTQTIGIRELRQHASRYVAAARDGQEFVVTDRGEPVARLVPLSPLEKTLDRLIREVGVIPPTSSRPIWEIEPLPADGQDWMALLDETREERL